MLGINQDLRSVALFGVISALVIWLLSSFNVFDSLNARLYELSSPVFFDAPEPQVVSLAVDQQHMANEVEFSKLIAKLQAFSPGRLLLLTDGLNLPLNFDDSMTGLAIVPLLQHSTDYMGDKRLSLNRQLAKFPPSQVAIPSLRQGGMLRSAIFNYRDHDGQSFSSFLLDFESPPSNKSEFLINFDKIPVYIPEITSEQVLQDKIIAQLVRGKLVLMGSGYIASQSILERPGADDNMGITVLQSQALSLQAVLSGAYLGRSSAFETFVIVALNLAVILIVMQSLSSSANLFILSGIIISGSLLIVIVGHLLEKILPFSEYLFSSLLSYGLYIHLLQNRMNINENRLAGDIKTQLSSIIEQQGFNAAEQPWLEISSFVSQYLILNKSIFLEKVPKDHRVKEIHTLNCSIDDILEQRRDYERTPYSTALKENGPIGLERPYFKKLEVDEVEFLAPLTFAGGVFGFWAITIKPDDGWNKDRFLFNVQRFSEQIGYLLYQRESFRRKNNQRSSLMQRSLGLFVPHNPNNALQYNVHSALRHLSLYQAIFNSMHSAAIIYDLFGSVVEVNQSMEKIIGRCDLNVFNINALEFVCNITGIEENDARGKLRYVIIAQKKTNFTTTFELDNHTYMVSVTPVVADASLPSTVNNEEYPFSVIGLLVEFIDVESVKHVITTVRGVNHHYLDGIKDNLSIMQLLLLRNEQKNDPNSNVPHSLIQGLQTQLSVASRHTKNADKIVNELITDTGSATEPVDIFGVYQACVRDNKAAIDEKRIRLDEQFPKIFSPVIANLDMLHAVIKLIFEILLEDSLPNTAITIVGRHKHIKNKSTFHLSIRNSGFGIPQDHIRRSLDVESSSNDVSSNLVELKEQLNAIAHWGAKGRISSQLGEGFHISLIFRGLLFSDE